MKEARASTELAKSARLITILTLLFLPAALAAAALGMNVKEITGDPSCLTTFKKLHPETVEAGLIRNPGVVATAMHCVNAIPYVCAAEPGIRTYLDLPLIAGRFAG